MKDNLAEELEEKFKPDYPFYNLIDWQALALFVKRREIEARIEGINRGYEIGKGATKTTKDQEIVQLAAMKEGEKE